MSIPDRAGRYIQQSTGYRAFVPAPLPPDPPLAYDGELQTSLSTADRDLARLDAIAALLPNPDLFVAMYVRHEAVLSSQIEGTQSTLEDVLAFEADAVRDDTPKDVEEVVNYVRAMNHGLARLPELPLSLRLLREIHAELMQGVRGGDKSPGEFRISQNWIGGRNSTLANASFVPPPPHELMNALGALEKFLHEARSRVPLLVRCGLAHAQFETIHPFLDGNGRVGRLLITLMLCEDGALSRPLLYLSLYLKAHRAEYYDRLTAIRAQGHWEQWLVSASRPAWPRRPRATSSPCARLTAAPWPRMPRHWCCSIRCTGSPRSRSTRWHRRWAALSRRPPSWCVTSRRAAGCAN
jgi:Fic family protein